MIRVLPSCVFIVLVAVAGCGTPTPAGTRLPGASLPESPAIHVGDDVVTVMGSGEATFNRIRALMSGAQRSIHLEMYEFGRSDLAATMIDAHGRGVEVTAIVDPGVEVTALTAHTLRAAGVDVLDYPVHRRMIDHVKLLVVDSRTAVVGGINWGASSTRNHDFDTLATGPVVSNLDRVFARDLVTCGRRIPVPDPVPDRGILVAATGPNPDIHPLALNLVDGARDSIDMEQFVLTDTAVVHSLERAHQRGIRIRLLLDPDQRPSDHAAEELRASGVDTRLYHGSGEKLHAKVAVADHRTVLFGSANWTNSGFQHNHEVDIEIVNSPAVAAAFQDHINSDWAAAES